MDRQSFVELWNKVENDTITYSYSARVYVAVAGDLHRRLSGKYEYMLVIVSALWSKTARNDNH